MKKIIPVSIQNRLKQYQWVVRLYQRLVLRIPPSDSLRDIIEQQNVELSSLPVGKDNPLFSIVVPVYKPSLVLFKEMIQSVMTQSYANWQLILVDDCSQCETLAAYLNQLTDERVIVVVRKENGHISAASNSGLEAATGDFIALLDQDDLIHQDALKCVAHYIEQNPNAAIFYSDEDKLDAKGNRHTPHFKPALNPDLLYSHNYVSHLGVYRSDIVKKVAGFRVGYEGSQDYDLLLRAVDLVGYERVCHIPYILYHWRALAGSTALAEGEKSYTADAGARALSDHLATKGALVEAGKLTNTYQVNWPIPTGNPLVSIIIPTKNGLEIVKQCIESIEQKTDYVNYEILLIDNQSDEQTAIDYFKQLDQQKRVRLIHYNKLFNYSAINNFAVSHAKGDYLVLMNNDIEILTEGWLSEMLGHLYRDDIGCVGSKLYYPDGTLQHAGVVTGLGGVAGHSHKHFNGDHPGYFKRLQVTQNLSAVTAACLGVRKSVFEEVGGLNERDLTIAFNDVDFCLKVQAAGYRNLWSPKIEMVHHESISRGHEDTPEKQARFASEVNYMKKTWGEQLLNDPNYSQWLTLDREDFSYR
ncbi:glycosyltransferase [Vibrio sp. 10N.261.52.F3]|uniref:glycosyltransferase family 2 protein n=1 Tax=Vibrio sp. 10N.261.52.F3 TaxID=3229683 RepID=UPI00354F55B0